MMGRMVRWRWINREEERSGVREGRGGRVIALLELLLMIQVCELLMSNEKHL